MKETKEPLKDDEVQFNSMDFMQFSVFNALKDVVLIYDRHMNIKKANDAFLKKFNFNPAGFSLKDILKIFSCRNIDGSPFLLEQQPTPLALKGFNVEGRIFSITFNGIESFVETSSSPLKNNGIVLGTVTVWHDITDKVIIQKALDKSESLHRKITELSPIGIFIIRDNLVEYANQTALEMLELKHLFEITGKPIDFILFENDYKKTQKIFEELINGKSFPNLEFKLIRSENDFVDVEVLSVNISDEQGKALYLFVRDISSLKKAKIYNKTLEDIEKLLFTSKNSLDIAQRITEIAAKALGCNSAAVSFWSGDFWEIKHTYNFSEEIKGTLIPFNDEPHAIIALKEKQLQLIEDTYIDPRTNKKRLKNWGIPSVAVVPLFTGNSDLGVIFFNFYKKRRYSIETKQFLTRLSTAVSLALENISLLENLQEKLIEKQKNEQKLLQLNSILMAISKCSKLMMDIKDENEIANQMCQIIIQETNHLLVWVGFIKNGNIMPDFWAGKAETYLKSLKIELNESIYANGPTGRAIRLGTPIVCNNILTDETFKPWKEKASTYGIQSTISLPLVFHGNTFGVLNIYSKDTGVFQSEEILLLSELSKFLSQGIMSIRINLAKQKAEALFKESEERFRLLTEKSNAIICELSSKGKILYVNEMFKEVFGLPEELSNEVRIFMENQYKANSTKEQELELRDKEGTCRWFGFHKNQFFTSTGEMRYSLIFFEISDIKQTENRLKELNATKDKFFSIIAHDLKNPFASLIGASELLSKNSKKFDAATIENLSIILYDSSKRTYTLLQNLLDWSRSQTNTINFNPEKISIPQIITQTVHSMESFALSKKQKINIAFSENIEASVDKNMFETIMRNLIMNAIKFTRRRGKIKITLEKNDNQLKIVVIDNGIGIAAENLHKLFRIDKKYTNLGTDNEQGTGLGLILCKEFVEKHKGTIGVESEPQKGSKFYLTLPL